MSQKRYDIGYKHSFNELPAYIISPYTSSKQAFYDLHCIFLWRPILQLNKLKTQEVVFHDSRRRHSVQPGSHRRCCRTSPVKLRWKSSASPSAATCRRLTTSAVLSALFCTFRLITFTASQMASASIFGFGSCFALRLVVVVSHILTIGQQPSRRRCICKCNLTGYEMEICVRVTPSNKFNLFGYHSLWLPP